MFRRPDDPIPPWEARFDDRQQRALAAAQSLSVGLLEGSPEALLVDGLLADYAAAEIAPLYDEFRIDTHETPTAPGGPPQFLVSFTLPCHGAATLLMSTTPRPITNTYAKGDDFEIVLNLEIANDFAVDQDTFTEWIAKARSEWFDQVAKATSTVNTAIREHRSAVRAAVEPVVRRRRNARLLVSRAAQALEVPLDRRAVPGAPIPLRPRTMTLASIEASAAAGGNEAGLAADIADALVGQIGSFGAALERMPVTANRLAGADEEGIRDLLLFILNANWQGTAMGETFLGEGKTDILLRWRDRDAFIGECKFWLGEKAFSEGVDQLLGRYTVWRATRVALVLFIRNRADISAVIDKAVSAIRSHARFLGDSEAGPNHSSFLMRAQRDNQKVVTVTLIPIVIPN